MDFRNGQFVATVPAMFSSQMLGGKQLGSMATLTANINSGFEEPVSWQCMSHSLKVTNNYMGKVELIRQAGFLAGRDSPP